MVCKPWRRRSAVSSSCGFWRFVFTYFFIVFINIVVTLNLHLYRSYVEAEGKALLTAPFFLPEPEAFLGTVAGAGFFPLPATAFFLNDGCPVSDAKSLPCSSTSITIESTDSASSLSASGRALAFPLFDSSISMSWERATGMQTFTPLALPDLCSSMYCLSCSSRTLSS